MRQGMTIGGLAKAAGVNVETIRYYQRRGLIHEPYKPPGGHRRYPSLALEQIAFIRRAQQLGFSLAEVQSLLAMSDGKSCRETRVIAETKVASLEVHIAHLQKMRRQLKALVAKCRKSKGRRFCPFIASLLDQPA
jgi:MerR family transcriptional regulator, mercuric resistance operon regulatory protein